MTVQYNKSFYQLYILCIVSFCREAYAGVVVVNSGSVIAAVHRQPRSINSLSRCDARGLCVIRIDTDVRGSPRALLLPFLLLSPLMTRTASAHADATDRRLFCDRLRCFHSLLTSRRIALRSTPRDIIRLISATECSPCVIVNNGRAGNDWRDLKTHCMTL